MWGALPPSSVRRRRRDGRLSQTSSPSAGKGGTVFDLILCIVMYSDTVLNVLMFCSSDAGPRCSSPVDSEIQTNRAKMKKVRRLLAYTIYVCICICICFWIIPLYANAQQINTLAKLCNVLPNFYKHLFLPKKKKIIINIYIYIYI